MGFLLPDDPDVTQLAYYLVAIPDAPEYRQAIKGHYGELGNAKLWGAEKVTSASYVAAKAWLRAIDETWRLIEMGWPDLLLTYIDDIETLLQAMQGAGSVGCCPEGTTYYPPADFDFDSVPQPIVDAGFATSTSDTAGYADYRCMAAHMLLSNIQDKLDKLAPIILGGFALFNIVAGLLGGVLILGGGGATLVVAGLAVDVMAILGVISALDDVTAEMVTGWADTLEDDRDTIVCAMQGADGAAAVKAALVAAVTDSIGAVGGTLVSFFNLDHLINAWWYGENNGVDLVQQMADAGHDPSDWTCNCEEPIPDGYELIPFSSLGLSCILECGYWSLDGNVQNVSLAPENTNIAVSFTTPSNMVGMMLRTHKSAGTGGIKTGPGSCNGNTIFFAEVTVNDGANDLYQQYFDSSMSSHWAAWTDYRTFYGITLDTSNGPCQNAAGHNIRPRSGSWAGTFEGWFICTV